MDVMEISEENLEEFLPLLGEDLSEDVKRAYFNGIGATDDDGQPVGAFVYELLNSESEEDTKGRICFLKSDNDAIFDSLGEYYSRNSAKEDEIVESFYELESEAEANALKKTGFSLEKKESDTIEITLGDLSRTALGKNRKIPDYVGNIDELSILQFRGAVKEILFKGYTGILEDIHYLPKTWFDARISACVNSGGKVPGLFLIRQTPSGILIPAFLFAYGPEYQKNLLYMIGYSLHMALQVYSPETKVRVPRKNKPARALTDKILPGQTGAQIFFGTRKE